VQLNDNVTQSKLQRLNILHVSHVWIWHNPAKHCSYFRDSL